MLTLTNVSLERDRTLLFKGLNMTVHARQKVGVVGRNGVGKSTLFSLILGELHSDAGNITLPREWQIAHLAQNAAVSQRCALDYVIDGHKTLRRTERELAESELRSDHMKAAQLHVKLDDLGAYQAPAKAGAILHGLGFSAEDTRRPYNEFSGGWRIRLNLAQALMAPADLLLLDEPTNHLDLEATLWLEQWLQRFPGTLLTIAHDRDFLDNVVDHVAHVTGFKVDAYRGNYSGFEKQRAAALTLQQAAHAKQQHHIKHINSFVTRFRAKASKAKQVQSRVKALERMMAVAPVHADSPYQVEFASPAKLSHPLISLDNLSIGYGEVAVLENINESILPGARIGVLGENGAGKSTLLKCLVGEIAPLNGQIIRGQHASVGYFAQHQLENLDSGTSAFATLSKAFGDWREQACRDYLAAWGFPKDKVDRPVATLSGGERARLVLALIAAEKPAILVLDEPTNHLDLDMRDALSLALQDYSGALIIVAHDRSLLSRTVDEFWLVEDGAVRRMPGTLDTYTRQHNRFPAATDNTAEYTGATRNKLSEKKSQRQAAAEQRRRTQPLKNKIRQLESSIEKLEANLKSLEKRLADPEIYHTLPAQKLDALLKEAAQVRKKRDSAEQAWLTTCEELEKIQFA